MTPSLDHSPHQGELQTLCHGLMCVSPRLVVHDKAPSGPDAPYNRTEGNRRLDLGHSKLFTWSRIPRSPCSRFCLAPEDSVPTAC